MFPKFETFTMLLRVLLLFALLPPPADCWLGRGTSGEMFVALLR